MYAIVDIAGQQLKVEKDQKIFVNRLEGAEGSKVSFDKVLLLDNDGKVQVGTPVVENCVVSATIVSHLKGDKVLVFKKKRRKGYQKLNGHRQYLTQLLIDAIGEEKKAPKKETAKAEAKEETKAAVKEVKETKEVKAETETVPATKKAAPKAEAKTTAKTETKKAAPKTTAKKAPAAKKAAPKKTEAKGTKASPAAKAPKKSASDDKTKE